MKQLQSSPCTRHAAPTPQLELTMPTTKLCAALLFSAFCLSALAEEEAAVTPYRPSVSSPAQLPLPGQLELEYGGLMSKTDDVRRNSIPYQLKLAFNQQWGVLLGGEAYVAARDGAGNRARGLGDTTAVLKRAFLMSDTTAFGLEFGAKIPTAKDTIGSGKADYSINSIFSKDISKAHMDANFNVTQLGAHDPGTSPTQSGLSTSFSMPVSEKWGLTAEVSGTHRNGAANTGQVLTAATYSPSKRLTIDIGVARGLTSASPDWVFFTGVVMPVAKLW